MPEPDTHDPVASLLKQAGRRPQPSVETAARIREKVHAEWSAGIQRRRRNRWMAMAAGIGVLALAGVLALGLFSRQQPMVAQLDAGGAVEQGEKLEVAPGRGLVLHTEAGRATVRVAGGSAIRFEAPEQLRLLAGSLYVDAATEGRALPRLVVLADEAVIEHIGTQFLVRRGEGRVEVAVRSGSVELRSPRGSATLVRGEMGSVGAEQGVQKVAASPSGDSWSWVDALAPALPIEGLSLYEALTRLSNEAGYELAFDSPQTEMSARETVLHGPALGLSPGRALRALLATTNFESDYQPGSRLSIRMR